MAVEFNGTTTAKRVACNSLRQLLAHIGVVVYLAAQVMLFHDDFPAQNVGQ